jgi:23S rRNA (cytidine1920-2'-O)/16S rRNA (cytidine1409-2'-O)-methyltransferase
MRERLDKLLVGRGLTPSRERARALIMEGKVLVDGRPVTKAGTLVGEASSVALREPDIPYVSRGGLKLRAAVEHFGIDLKDKTVMDVGASTGGFTDYMLGRGAGKVYAIDVGYGQFDWGLRKDGRVVLLERTNVRYLERERIPEGVDLATVDVSFISLRNIIPRVMEFLRPGGEIIALVKPQFEVGRAEVGKGGIVREEEKRLEAVGSLREFFEGRGLVVVGTMESPVRGQKGNIEYFIYLRKPGEADSA